MSEQPLLRELAAQDVLLAFDYDGTLAPIVADPEQAFMSRNTRELLWELTRRYPVIVITGRAQSDALRRLRGVGVLEVVGNHGIEPRYAANRYAELVRDWRRALEPRCQELPGVQLEDKVYSLAIHYRQASDHDLARAAIMSAVSSLGADAAGDGEKPQAVGGKCVINLLPQGAIDKGLALLRECERLSCTGALYVGDDETDETVFARAQPGRLLGIRVGARDDSAASHFLPNQAAIDELLRILIALRPEVGQGRRRAPGSVHQG